MMRRVTWPTGSLFCGVGLWCAVLGWSAAASPETLGPLAANGLHFAVEQWRGKEAVQQLERLRKDFAGPVQHRGDWQQLGRIRDGVSEVLQWRSERHEPWVLLSRLDLRRAPVATSTAAWALPRGCRQGLHVASADGAYQVVQRRLVCSQGPDKALRAMTAAALAQGWRVGGAVGDRILLQRGQHSISMQPLPPFDVLMLQRGPGAVP